MAFPDISYIVICNFSEQPEVFTVTKLLAGLGCNEEKL